VKIAPHELMESILYHNRFWKESSFTMQFGKKHKWNYLNNFTCVFYILFTKILYSIYSTTNIFINCISIFISLTVLIEILILPQKRRVFRKRFHINSSFKN